MGQNESISGLDKKANYVIFEADTNVVIGVLSKGRYQTERLWDMIKDHFCMRIVRININTDTTEDSATLLDDEGNEYTYNLSVIITAIY